MNASFEIINAFKNLKLHEANEAETRLKLIDRVLFEVLGWTHDDVAVEERVSEDGTTTFADYILRTANTAVVVEAKKIGATFEAIQAKRRVKLAKSFVTGVIGEAITQARDYCRKLGIDFAVVTNGNYWIVFPAQRHDQVGFHESSAIVFQGVKSILNEDFQEFYDLLSRDAVISGSLEIHLIGRTEDQLQSRKLRNFFKATSSSRRNPVYPLIEEGITTAFSDSIAESDPELLEKCYVSSPERMKFDRTINLNIVKRIDLFKTQPLRPMKSQEANALRNTIQSSIRSSKPLAVLILGTVGAGKTTFLHYTRKIKAKDIFEKRSDKPYPHWIYIDFRNYPAGESVVDFIYSNLRSYLIQDDYFSDLNRSIRSAYKDEIEHLKTGIFALIAKDKDRIDSEVFNLIKNDYEKIKPYVDRLIKFGAQQAPIFLVIDNVDQFESETTQSALFADAIALGHRLGVNLILALRGSTYVNHKNSPTFNAFDFDPIYIDPPKISSVLSKRFFLTKHILNGKSGLFVAENGATIKLDNVATIIDLVQSSVLGTEIGNVIEVLASDDVRLALRMTREFLESGYTNPGKALQLFNERGAYVLPRHEAFRSILLGNQPVYSEDTSVIGNPFDARLGRTNSQLLRLYILAGVVNEATSAKFQHIDGLEIANYLAKIGFGHSTTEKVLKDLCELRFLHTSGQTEASLSCSYIPTRLGGYIVRNLLSNFTFLENMLMDTFIPDVNVWERLRVISQDIDAERQIVKRVQLRTWRVKVFYNFMKSLYDPLILESQRRGLAKEWAYSLFDEMRPSLMSNLATALRSARRTYGKNQPSNLPIDSHIE